MACQPLARRWLVGIRRNFFFHSGARRNVRLRQKCGRALANTPKPRSTACRSSFQDTEQLDSVDKGGVFERRGSHAGQREVAEVFPQIELQDYQNLAVPYRDPQITDEDVAKRLEEVREQKADYSNVDPRPIQDGDYAVLAIVPSEFHFFSCA